MTARSTRLPAGILPAIRPWISWERRFFLADKLDPQKRNRYPYSSYLHHLAMEDLDEAMLEFLNRELAARVSRSQLVHPVMVDTRNALLLSLNRAALGPE